MEQGQVDHGYQTAVALPRWFIWLVSVLLGVGGITVLPWVVWQTRATMRLEIQMDTLAKIDGKMDVLLALDGEFSQLERRMTAAESDIASRRGNRWTKVDHEKYVLPRLDNFEARIRNLELKAESRQ